MHAKTVVTRNFVLSQMPGFMVLLCQLVQFCILEHCFNCSLELMHPVILTIGTAISKLSLYQTIKINDQKKELIHVCREQLVKYSLNQNHRLSVTISFND